MTATGLKRIIVTICAIVISVPVFSIEPAPDYRHEVAITPGAVYFSNDQSFAPGLHLEYGYGFSIGRLEMSAGITGDVVFADHKHYGIGLGLGFPLFKNIHLHAGPGLAFEEDEVVATGNIGLGYGFDLGRFSMGPVTEFSFDKHESHFMFGVLFGYAF